MKDLVAFASRSALPAGVFPQCLLFLILPLWIAVEAVAEHKKPAAVSDLWALKPVVRPEIPASADNSKNPIDAFLGASAKQNRVTPLPASDGLTWLRRVSYDLVGLPPTLNDQEAFLADQTASASEKVVDRLLASDQHGVRYGRHWLDVLRFADVDEDMPAAPGLHLWRDWVIHSINANLPYDEFVRAQICGNRAAKRRIISAAGHLTPVEPRPEDLFASGFLARGAARQNDPDQQLAFMAVETISSAFLGMTVGCAKCHDHFYDPIKQSDYYSMKALFDPLVLRRVELATAEQLFTHGKAVEEHDVKMREEVEAMRRFIEPHHTRLYEERLRTFPPEVQAAIRKPEEQRNAAERKSFDDYYPILRIDPPKLKAVMTTNEVRQYEQHLKRISELKPPPPLPVFWTVEEDAKRADQERFILVTGNPERPKKSAPVKPGFLFAQEHPDISAGRREAFVDWLTAPSNPLFARVAVNRIWQWHFGSGLHGLANDFGTLGGKAAHPELLDWLASEFVARRYDMKWLHRLIVTSDTYRRASRGHPELERENSRIDPENRLFWRFPLRRLEAEPIRDAILQTAGKLDTRLGGKSFAYGEPGGEGNRRTAYMQRGYRASEEKMPEFLQSFDAEDGRNVCARRTQTVTAPQALWLMNDELVDGAATAFGNVLKKQAGGDLAAAVRTGFQTALCRTPTASEQAEALRMLGGDEGRLKEFAWLLLNLDEFLYLR